MQRRGEKLNITPSTISSSIRKLEEQLDTKLFDRNQDGVSLTKRGKELNQMIRSGMESIEMAEKIMLDKTDLTNGEITIGSQSHIIAFLLLDIIKKVEKEYPGLDIKMISNASSYEIMELLKQRKVNFVIMGIIPEKYRIDENFIIKPIKNEKYILY